MLQECDVWKLGKRAALRNNTYVLRFKTYNNACCLLAGGLPTLPNSFTVASLFFFLPTNQGQTMV